VTTAEAYLERLDALTGQNGKTARYRTLPSTSHLPPVACIEYADCPEPGLTATFTYGLSLAEHPDWRLVRPELCLCLRSTDEAWGAAAARVGERHRGLRSFAFGSTFALEKPISNESKMSAFLTFAPAILDASAATVRLPGVTIQIVGIYPIYSGEIRLLDEIGLEAFWAIDFDPYDPRRPDLSR
jgi:hypothetical protein